LDRFQDPDIAMQNPDYAPRPAIWKLKDKIQIPNSETAVSVYAPALTLHREIREDFLCNCINMNINMVDGGRSEGRPHRAHNLF
jgi:hypothetical protein